MIEFVSLLLGLLNGVQPVELSVAGEVAAVEVRLDGEVVHRREQPPWRFDCDLGQDLRPHELTAMAFDASGREVGRARRWINLSRTEIGQAALSWIGGDDGWPVAVAVNWEAIGQRRAPEIVISFDDQPLAVDDPARIPLPAYDPADLHVVSAEVRFTGETSRLDAVFGGAAGRQISTELTAVAVVLEKGRRLRAEDLQGWFLKDGRALTVHGVEKGIAEIVVVRDPEAVAKLERLSFDWTALPPERRQAPPVNKVDRLGEDIRMRLLTPLAAPLSEAGVSAGSFVRSPWMAADKTGFLWQAVTFRPQRFPALFANAVAVAGLHAHAATRRRAVVLMLGGSASGGADGDGSYSVAMVRRYLEDLQVPFYAWSLVPPSEAPDWQAVDLQPDTQGVVKRAGAAIRAVRESLQSQRIVWLQGRHLPQSIALSPAARGICLAGTPGCG